MNQTFQISGSRQMLIQHLLHKEAHGKNIWSMVPPSPRKVFLGDMKYIPMEIIMCGQNTQRELKNFLSGERFCLKDKC